MELILSKPDEYLVTLHLLADATGYDRRDLPGILSKHGVSYNAYTDTVKVGDLRKFAPESSTDEP